MIGRPVKQFTTPADDGVKWMLHQIDRGLKLRKEQEDRWEHNESFEDLKQWSGELGVEDEVTINKVGSWIRSRRASLAYKNPRAKVTPKTNSGWEPVPVPMMGPDGTPKMDPMTGQVEVRLVAPHMLAESLLNNTISSPMFGLRGTISRLIKASSLGYGVLKVGYRPEFETPYSENDPEQKVKITPEGIDFSGYMLNPVTGQPILDDDGNLIDRTKIPAFEAAMTRSDIVGLHKNTFVHLRMSRTTHYSRIRKTLRLQATSMAPMDLLDTILLRRGWMRTTRSGRNRSAYLSSGISRTIAWLYLPMVMARP
jgi:hypothetical protein